MHNQHILSVAEIFASLQGEGPFMGQPAVFVRLAGCVPPFCSWCDTPHALAGGRPMSPEDLLERVVRHPHKLVVITGGEPFLQWDTGLSVFVDMLIGSGRSVQYETSGKAGIPADHQGFVVCSPKPQPDSDTSCPQALYLAPEHVARVGVFKFVVNPDAQVAGDTAGDVECLTLAGVHAHSNAALQPILHFIKANAIAPSRVWLMPLGSRREEQMQRMEAVWNLCVRYGFNFAPRLHILAFDDRKGI